MFAVLDAIAKPIFPVFSVCAQICQPSSNFVMMMTDDDNDDDDSRDKEDGISPMMAAVGAGRLEVVRHLVNQYSHQEMRMMMMARIEGYITYLARKSPLLN